VTSVDDEKLGEGEEGEGEEGEGEDLLEEDMFEDLSDDDEDAPSTPQKGKGKEK